MRYQWGAMLMVCLTISACVSLGGGRVVIEEPHAKDGALTVGLPTLSFETSALESSVAVRAAVPAPAPTPDLATLLAVAAAQNLTVTFTPQQSRHLDVPVPAFELTPLQSNTIEEGPYLESHSVGALVTTRALFTPTECAPCECAPCPTPTPKPTVRPRPKPKPQPTPTPTAETCDSQLDVPLLMAYLKSLGVEEIIPCLPLSQRQSGNRIMFVDVWLPKTQQAILAPNRIKELTLFAKQPDVKFLMITLNQFEDEYYRHREQGVIAAFVRGCGAPAND